MLTTLTFLLGLILLAAAIYETVCIERLRREIEAQSPTASRLTPASTTTPCHTASKAA